MKFAAGLALSLALLACKAPVAEPVHSPVAEGPSATGFLSANVPPPEGASVSGDDGVPRDSYGRPFAYALLGAPLPVFSASLLDGTAFNTAEIDQWTVIDIWGVWCGDCRADAPYVHALSQAIADDPDLDFISIHVPASAARTSADEMFGKFGSIEAYFQSVGHVYPVIVDTDARLRALLKVSWTPSYLLVSPDGVVRGFRTEFAAAGGEPVADFLRDVARVKSDLRRTPAIGPQGAMQLAGPATFTLPAIEAGFPGLQVVPVAGDAPEGGPAFRVLAAGGETLFTVRPDWTRGYAGTVVTTHPGVAGPRGEGIGRTRLRDLASADRANCTPSPRAPEQLDCPAAAREGAGAFIRVFGAPGKDGDAVLIEMRYDAIVPGKMTP